MNDITKDLISQHYEHFTLATPKEIIEKYPIMDEFFKWINWNRNKTVCLRFNDNENRYRIKLFSEFYEYAIDVAPSRGREHPYIGCVFSCRRAEPMETWTRGNDMTDGFDGEKTIMQILMEIVENELVRLDVEGYDDENTRSRSWKKVV